MPKYVLTGTTGGLGSQVLKHLLQLVPASDIIVSLYNPAGAPPSLRESGVEIRRGDYADPASLDAAFAGAVRLLLVSYPSITPDAPVQNHARAIAAARRAGVRHVFYTSLAFAPESGATVMRAHPLTEAQLAASGLAYTVVREGVYSESFPLYFGLFDPLGSESEALVPYADGRIAYVAREDLGEATARILAAESGYENRTVVLTGERAISMREIAAMLSELLAREISVKFVTVDEYVRRNVGRYGPQSDEASLREWATCHLALERGELEVVDPILRQILGRAPKPFEETLGEMIDLGRA